ncbi:hypothetical protein B0H14DRAFT_2851867 [Mycena olivaceomarginata]|nr:hypothetical protein B0H14DRAFT_2851867 [Mycena olivaceomarginata]
MLRVSSQSARGLQLRASLKTLGRTLSTSTHLLAATRLERRTSCNPQTLDSSRSPASRPYSKTPSQNAEEPDSTDPEPLQTADSEAQALARLEGFADRIDKFIPGEDNGRLRVSYALIYEILQYLCRHGEGSETYLTVFMNHDAEEGSNLYRARKSVRRLTEIVVKYLSAVGPSLREKHSAVFNLFGALEPLCMFQAADTPQEWKSFWGRAQPILVELGVELDKAGFGAD